MNLDVQVGAIHPVYWSFEGNCEVGEIRVTKVLKKGFNGTHFAFVDGVLTTIDGRTIEANMVTVHPKEDVDKIDFYEVENDFKSFFLNGKPHIGNNFEFNVDWAKRLLAWIDRRNYSEMLGAENVAALKSYIELIEE